MRLLKRVALGLLALYAAVLLASTAWWVLGDGPPARPLPHGKRAVALPHDVRMAYAAFGPEDAPVVVLIHGSPGRGSNFMPAGREPGMAHAIAQRYRVLVPDLPGFGDSTLDAPDLSIDAHADALLALLDAEHVERAHLVGYSMGGGPALLAWDRAPDRVASVVLLSSIGVQEMELLGDYTLNHALHELQLLAFRAVRCLVPHFGDTLLLDKAVAYARNFAESDQRPLRPVLERFEPPLLVLHGSRDPLVPVAAAREHHRVVPQSELWVNDQSHFMVFEARPALLDPLLAFLDAVEDGSAARRADATADRLARAAEPFDPSSVPPSHGFFLVLLMVLLALSTLVSEDLTCIAAGLMAAEGRLSWIAASGACLAGIFLGDLLLFLAGRVLGRPAVRRAPLKWLVTETAIERSRRWFDRKGPVVILISRFTPGMRLPTYVAAGVLGTGVLKFCAWFLLAGVLWTPALVGLSMIAGDSLLHALSLVEAHPMLGLAVVVAGLLVVLKLVVPMLTHRGRRLLRGRWMRLTRWEFWPPWAFYPPIVGHILWNGVRHRSLSVVTAVNPMMPAGGIIGESKADILAHLRRCLDGTGALPASLAVPADPPDDERLARVRAFLDEHALAFPVVLKPDAGQRGSGVEIVHADDDLPAALARLPVDVVAQEFVTGVEYGLFYARHPDDAHGEIFSITEKIAPTVTGDGTRTVEELLLDDPRAPACHRAYSANLGERLEDVPAPGEVVKLTEVGAHARGTIFRDGRRLHTPELEAAVDALSRRIDGFSFGRYDVIVPSEEHLRRGEGLRIIELNGLTSEATHIYDAKTPLLTAWFTLCDQWDRAFAIGAANRARGAPTTSVLALLGMAVSYLRTARRR